MLPSSAYSDGSAQLPSQAQFLACCEQHVARILMTATSALFPWFPNAPPPQSQDQDGGATSSSLIAGARSPGKVGGQGGDVAGEGEWDKDWRAHLRSSPSRCQPVPQFLSAI